MEFDDAKENIQPLASGRNASILHASITHTSKELNEQRRELESTIRNYNGDDPLEPWYNYISWIEQMFPSGGKESGLMQVLTKCLRKFESEERYYQDRRMIKLFIKCIYSHKDPLECFQQLFSGGIGTMVADFYIAWAYCYDSIGRMQKSNEIFRRGIECRAEPLAELKEAYEHFKSAVAERVLFKDDDDALQNTNRELEERRLALSSLRGYRKRKNEIGSIRTGAAIKSFNPGTLQSTGVNASTSSNARFNVLNDENLNPNANAMAASTENNVKDEVEGSKSTAVIRSIVDHARHLENEPEPGPWDKVHDKKNIKKLLRQKSVVHDIGFSIHEDVDMEIGDGDDNNSKDELKLSFENANEIVLSDAEKRYEKPFKYPQTFVSHNRPQAEWVLPITAEVAVDSKTIPCYKKYMVYPRPNREFQMEEYMGYRFYQKRGIENAFTRRYDSVWGVNNINVPFRMYPNFAHQSKPQELDELDVFEANSYIEGMIAPTMQLYDVKAQEEFQLEELMAREWFSSQNKTVMEPQDMDETNCASSTNETVQRRKSFFPARRSLAIRKIVADRVELPNVTHEKMEKPQSVFGEKTDEIAVRNKASVDSKATNTLQKPSVSNEEVEKMHITLVEKVLESEIENLVPGNVGPTVSTALQQPHSKLENSQVTFAARETQIGNKKLVETSANISPQQQNAVVASIASADNQKSCSDEESIASATVGAAAANKENDFQFKLPAPPTKLLKTQNENLEADINTPFNVVSNKLPFEIFVEENVSETCTANVAPVQSAFDAEEETCSTLMFNVCLKSQSVSTPKMEFKSHKRPFSVLRDIEKLPKPTSPIATTSSTSSGISISSSASPSDSGGLVVPPFSLSPQSPLSSDSDVVPTLPTNSFSPQIRKQLSTILETSEVGTHSAATTKSSDGIQDPEISEATAGCPTEKTQIEIMENTQGTKEIGLMRWSQKGTDQQLFNSAAATTATDAINLFGKSPVDRISASKSQCKSEIALEIEAATQKTYKEASQIETDKEIDDNCSVKQEPSNLKFTIFQDPTETVPKISSEYFVAATPVAGNFERLVQCDDNTFERIPLQPAHFPADQTDTLSKFMGTRYIPEDKTENLTGNLLAVAKPQAIDTNNLKPQIFCDDDYDTLDFFRKSPVKTSATVNSKKEPNKARLNTHLTPLNDIASKRICVQDSPVDFKAPNPFPTNAAAHTNMLMKPNLMNINKNLLDTFMCDFSLTNQANKPTTIAQLGSTKLRDSLVPEFSFIEDTQPTKNAISAAEMPVKNYFAPTEDSFIAETQSPAAKKSKSPTLAHEYVENGAEISVIEETQKQQKDSSASKGAVPKIPLFRKSKLLEASLFAAPANYSSYFSDKHETSKLKTVDLMHTRSNLQQDLLTNFSCIADEEILGKSKCTANLQNISKHSVASTGHEMFLTDEKEKRLQMRESSFAMFDKTKSNKTENHHNVADNPPSSLTDSEEIIPATQKVDTFKNHKSTTPMVDELLESFNKSLKLSPKLEKTSKSKQSSPQKRISLIPIPKRSAKKSPNQTENNTKFSLLTPMKPQTIQWPHSGAKNNLAIFDFNAEGDSFASGINFLKNSTMFPDQQSKRQSYVRQSVIREPTLHIKTEAPTMLTNISENLMVESATNNSQSVRSSVRITEAEDEMSIYYKHTPRTPQLNSKYASWSIESSDSVEFVHPIVDLNETTQVIETKCIDPYVNPFDADLLNAFLENIDFINFLKNEPNTTLVGNVKRLQPQMQLEINNEPFKITKLIGQGNYGTVYCGVNTKTENKYAFKQERPPNYWEYYICLELQDRIKNDDVLLSYMKIEHAQIGNNASLFVSAFAPYGSIISVCNQVKKVTTKNVDEYVVMHLSCELLEIIDHLHAAEIIHADLKADNFLLMHQLTYNSKQTALHLIDFGVSIDMRQFKKTQVFTFINNEDEFKCVEMRKERPWTYQIDLFGLAGVIHVLLFGKYMEVIEKNSIWLPKQHMPRYINKKLWENIFRTLLNIADCNTMPNLQGLRQMLKEEMAEKERYVLNKIAEFNKALQL